MRPVVWDAIKIVLIVLGAPVALVLAILLLLGFASCFNVGVRFSNYDGKLLVFRYGLLRFKVLPKKPEKELSEEEKKRKEEKQQKKDAKRKLRRERFRRAWEKQRVRRAVRKEKRKARKALRDAEKGKKPELSSKANWLSEPVEGRTRAIFETAFDVLPKAAKLIRFDKIRLNWIIRGDDPAKTGISYGQKAALFGIIYPWMMQNLNIGTHNVNVDADFAHKGESDVFIDITVLLRPVKIVGFLFGTAFAWFSNKDRYCIKPETSKTTYKMKPDGGNKHGRKN
ncbi:MAG: DUF2953 domain-containing protein [Clostridia bacterium]|nr:DUF2953 domain-containing protein [Clostridia bacterium]